MYRAVGDVQPNPAAGRQQRYRLGIEGQGAVGADDRVLLPVAAFAADPAVPHGHGAGKSRGDGRIMGDQDDGAAGFGGGGVEGGEDAVTGLRVQAAGRFVGEQ